MGSLLKICFLATLGIGCYTAQIISTPNDDPGEELAKIYCGTCHQFPDPEILTKKSWNYLLTDMGFRLGIVDYQPIEAISPIAILHMTSREQLLNIGGLIPEQPLLTEKEWKAIREFYVSTAPVIPLPQSPKQKIIPNLPQFDLRIPQHQPPAAVMTLTRVDRTNGGILLGNQRDQSLTVLDADLKVTSINPGQEILVDVLVSGDSLYLLSIGDLMGRHIGVARGFLQLKRRTEKGVTDHGIVVENLHRPVDIEFADLNNDGKDEWIVCNFGDATGNVSIFDSKGTLIKELIQAPGAVRSQVYDFNKDGRLDIVVLMGDARENISLFINKGNHEYERKTVIECHSAYGHTYFELQDFNQDGHMDLLAVNGDTDADPFNTLKNYHGVRIYLNDGENNFELNYFYPMYGAHFAKACDFDKDGDLDIAVSAFFPDFSSDQPEQFTYLENTGDLTFVPYTHTETYQGRWMTMDIGDYDLDGDVDIVLGGGYLSLGMVVEYNDKFKSLVANGKAVLVFENTLIQ